MTSSNENKETPPAVDPIQYEGPSRREQRQWARGTTNIIIILAVIFAVIIIVAYFATR